jgi:conjugative transfer region protein TrbK
MRQYLSPRQFLWLAAVGFIVPAVVLAIIQSRHRSEAGIPAPPRHEAADALVSELVRCRTITLDQPASLETCRRLWAENRRQFFVPTKAPPAAAQPIPNSATASEKNQDRLPPVATAHQPGEVR